MCVLTGVDSCQYLLVYLIILIYHVFNVYWLLSYRFTSIVFILAKWKHFVTINMLLYFLSIVHHNLCPSRHHLGCSQTNICECCHFVHIWTKWWVIQDFFFFKNSYMTYFCLENSNIIIITKYWSILYIYIYIDCYVCIFSIHLNVEPVYSVDLCTVEIIFLRLHLKGKTLTYF